MPRRQARHAKFDHALVRSRRDALDLTNEEFARLVGVTLRTVQRWQTGESEPESYPQVQRLAAILQIDAADLYLEQAPAA